MMDQPSITSEKKVYSPEKIRDRFPVLHQLVNKKPLIYFDNAATTQKPEVVMEAIDRYYRTNNANIHRGIHTLAERATRDFEETRSTVKEFLHARENAEVVFTYGTTDAINLVASSYAGKFLKEGEEILISGMEHHSNIVPWQMICEKTGARLRIIPITDSGELLMEEFEHLLTDKTRIISIVHVSNALGTINPVKEIIKKGHEAGAVVLVDGAQAIAHLEVDVQDLDCDFYAISSHKIFGPTGTGILYGKREILEKMDPYRAGGEMINEVTFEKTTFNDLPYKFEAGTPNIADVIGFDAALKFFMELPGPEVKHHEAGLLAYATEKLKEMPGIRIIGQAENKIGIISFIMNKLHHYDAGMMLDLQGIAVRTGHHCTQPLMSRFNIEGTVRVSFSIYNTIEEIDRFVEALTIIATRK